MKFNKMEKIFLNLFKKNEVDTMVKLLKITNSSDDDNYYELLKVLREAPEELFEKVLISYGPTKFLNNNLFNNILFPENALVKINRKGNGVFEFKDNLSRTNVLLRLLDSNLDKEKIDNIFSSKLIETCLESENVLENIQLTIEKANSTSKGSLVNKNHILDYIANESRHLEMINIRALVGVSDSNEDALKFFKKIFNQKNLSLSDIEKNTKYFFKTIGIEMKSIDLRKHIVKESGLVIDQKFYKVYNREYTKEEYKELNNIGNILINTKSESEYSLYSEKLKEHLKDLKDLPKFKPQHIEACTISKIKNSFSIKDVELAREIKNNETLNSFENSLSNL